MDDLEVNPLHRAFLGQFRREFEIACKKSYVIAIPRSDTLEGRHIDAHFAGAHILIPSKLLRMHYNPSQAGTFDDIEIDNKQLVCSRSAEVAAASRTRLVVRILAEEIGYNALGKEYKILLVSQPLVAGPQPRSVALSLRTILAARSPSPAARKRRAHLLSSRVLMNHEDCAKYLEFISLDLTADLEREVGLFQSNYVILPHYLEDAADRTRRIAESYADKYELALGGVSSGGPLEVCDTIRRSLRLALESHVLQLVHGKLLAAIQSNCQARDRALARKFDLVLGSRLSICQLGAQSDFADFALGDDLTGLLRRLPSLQSPLDMVGCLVRIVDLISEALNQSVGLRRMLGNTLGGSRRQGPTGGSATAASSLELEPPVAICSDDLIASFVFCLPRARPSNLYSALRYLELFGWSATEKDATAYYLATFESAIAHILHFGKQSPGRHQEPQPVGEAPRHEQGLAA